MKESVFCTQLYRSFNLYCSDNKVDGFWHKIADGNLTRNPYDIYGLLQNRFFAIEAKVSRQKTKMNFPALFSYGKTFHELLNLKKASDLGHLAFVIVAHSWSNKQHTAFAIPISKAIEYYKIGSIKLEQIEDECIFLPRKRNDFRNELLYDLTPLFQ